MSGPNYDGRYGPINNSHMCDHCTQPAVYGILDEAYVRTGKMTWLCTTHNQALIADRRIDGNHKELIQLRDGPRRKDTEARHHDTV